LLVWQKGMECAQLVYAISKSFPSDEKFGLTSQVRRSAVSIPANISEGHGRGSRRDYAYFVSVAKGSVQETATLMELAERFGYASEDDALKVASLLGDLERMLGKLHMRLAE
jgi:four helix bundle protein